MLEKFDVIRVERFGNNVIYFNFSLETDFDTLHYFFHKKGTMEIFSKLMEKPGISFIELKSSLPYPRSTLIRKVKVLAKHGLLSVEYKSNQLVSIRLIEEYVSEVKKILEK